MPAEVMLKAKRLGFSDKQIALAVQRWVKHRGVSRSGPRRRPVGWRGYLSWVASWVAAPSLW